MYKILSSKTCRSLFVSLDSMIVVHALYIGTGKGMLRLMIRQLSSRSVVYECVRW